MADKSSLVAKSIENLKTSDEQEFAMFKILKVNKDLEKKLND